MATSAIEADAIPSVEVPAVPAVEADAIPSVEVAAVPAVEADAIPSVEVAAVPAVEADAIPIPFNEGTNQSENKLDIVLNKLTIDDYRSILFLLIDGQLKKEDFLFLVVKDINVLKNKFLNIVMDSRFKEALLIEILGTIQKYDLLKLFGTCRHVFEKDKETFTQLKSLWKFLYAVCEHLTDGEVDYLKEKLFPENPNINVCCAEDLICRAFLMGKLEEKENNWKGKLADVLKSFHPDCSKFVSSYKDSHLSYYPLRRPTKTAPCGIAVIMNHVKFDHTLRERPESNLDAISLKKLWESFGFKTEVYTDLTYEKVYEVFVRLSKENHSNHDAFVACYLSHGDKGIVFSKDVKQIVFEDLVDLIANKCDTLVGKPKLFFVQACQGSLVQTGLGGDTFELKAPVGRSSLSNSQISRLSRNVARHSDILMFNSSIDGFVSLRDSNGSWFVEELVSNMEKDGEEITITSVLTKVRKNVTEREGVLLNTNVTKCKQTPVGFNTLKYELKLKKVL